MVLLSKGIRKMKDNLKYANRLNSIWSKLNKEETVGSSKPAEEAEEMSLQIDWNCSCCDSGCKSKSNEWEENDAESESTSYSPSL